MNGLIESLAWLITAYLKRDFEEEEVRVAYTGRNMLVFIEDDYVELVKGSEYTLPRWIAQQLIEEGLAKPVDEPVDVAKVARIAFNESRLKSSTKFEKLSGYFYMAVNREVAELLRKYKSIDSVSKARELSERLDKLVASIKQLHKTRLSKLLSLLSMQELTPEALSNLSEEEKHLYSSLKTLLEVFNRNVFEVEKHG